MSDLQGIREEIDEIDLELTKLFIKRMDCAKKVAHYKKERNLPILNEKRENEVIETVQNNCGEYGHSAKLLYTNLMELSRTLQHNIVNSGQKMKDVINSAKDTFNKDEKDVFVASQGIKGANSHIATNNIFTDCQNIFVKSFEDVFKLVENGEAKYGVLPVENSGYGSVTDVYDLIIKYKFFIVGANNFKIKHCLAGANIKSLDEVKTVGSHPQALMQCSKFIKEHNLNTCSYSNTAVAAMEVSNQTDKSLFAICSKDAANEYDLFVVSENIQDNEDNSTRFVVISKELCIPQNANKISLCFALPHVTGSLYSILGRFSSIGLNLTKIESRPINNKNFEYLFYVDFTGNVKDENVKSLICALSDEIPEFTFLGNYEET